LLPQLPGRRSVCGNRRDRNSRNDGSCRPKANHTIIVKGHDVLLWQIVFAGARKAGKDLNVTVPELGAVRIGYRRPDLDPGERVSGKPAAIVIAPQFAALGKPIDEAAKKAIIIGIDSSADSKAFTSFLTPITSGWTCRRRRPCGCYPGEIWKTRG
jgi:hypothetical protein